MRVSPIVSFLSLLALFSCGSPAEPNLRSRVVVNADTVLGSLMGAVARVPVPTTFHNDSDGDLSLHPCSPGLDKEDGAAWTTVWRSVCTLQLGQEVRIGAGEHYQLLVTALAAPGFGWTPEDVPGRYRIRLVVYGPDLTSTTEVVSDPFVVRY